MTFLFVDSIDAWSLDKPIRGTYTIPYDSPYLVEDCTGDLQFIPSLIAEAIGQMGAWAVMNAIDFEKRPVAGVVSSVKMLGQAKPGDTLTLITYVENVLSDQIQYHGEAQLNGKPVLIIEQALGPFLPMSEFIDDAVVRAQCASIPKLPSIKDSMRERVKPADKAITTFDNIICFEKDKPVVAQKILREDAPYLKDHFPLKPVLPLSLFIHMKLGLAIEYIKAFTQFRYKKIDVRKIKMGQFVTPGDKVITTMTMKVASQDDMIFQFKSFVDDKRVCVSEARFYSR